MFHTGGCCFHRFAFGTGKKLSRLTAVIFGLAVISYFPNFFRFLSYGLYYLPRDDRPQGPFALNVPILCEDGMPHLYSDVSVDG